MLGSNMNDTRCIAVTGRAIGHGLRINGEIFAEKRLFIAVVVHRPSQAGTALSIALMILLKVAGEVVDTVDLHKGMPRR
jgi:hypothetical protein